MIEWCSEKWLFSQLSSEQTIYRRIAKFFILYDISLVRHWNRNWSWSLLGVKGLSHCCSPHSWRQQSLHDNKDETPSVEQRGNSERTSWKPHFHVYFCTKKLIGYRLQIDVLIGQHEAITSLQSCDWASPNGFLCCLIRTLVWRLARGTWKWDVWCTQSCFSPFFFMV